MQFIDVAAIHQESRVQIEEAIARVISHGRYINGPEVYEFEKALGSFLGGINCIVVSSGTAALEISLRALEVGPGDEVITTPFTWISSAETIGLVGATPVFADIDPDTYNISPQAIENAVTKHTKAIIPVNLFGQMADYAEIERIAKKHSLYIIEDAAQSLGASQNGQHSCTMGNISCTSFFPAKPLGCYGDGGAVFTSDPILAEKVRAIANHGGKTREMHEFLGMNGRCDTIQAAILLAKFPAFKKEIGLRADVAAYYTDCLGSVCKTPLVAMGNTSVYAQYTIRAEDRDHLNSFLMEKEIPTAIYYKKPVHLQPVFKELGYKQGDFPIAEAMSNKVLSIPFHPYIKRDDQDRIIEAIIECEESNR